MFVSQDKTPKKKFQKPNILRKKAKIPIARISQVNDIDTHNIKTFLNPSHQLERKNVEKEENTSLISVHCKGNKSFVPKEIVKSLNVEGKVNLAYCNKSSTDDISSIIRDTVLTVENDSHFIDLNEKHNDQMLNVETYISQEEQQVPFTEHVIMPKENVTKGHKKIMEFVNDNQKITIEQCDKTKIENIYSKSTPEMPSVVLPLSTISFVTHEVQNYDIMNEEVPTCVNIQNIYIDDAMEHTVIFKCDVSNCNEVFSTEHKLRKHRSLHNKDGSMRLPRKRTVECPVKKLCSNGVEERCEKIFNVREELIKHLNEDHTPEEAAYKCAECGRRFFWAPGLRAHVRAHGTCSRVLPCGWPGCGRVFRQPCRLREHTRAHTGDRPYPCRHPNCGWSFRTASKLVRHARRHTGERRHACAACGRAFLRREHLRDHVARHHERPRPALACAAPDCQHSFTNMSSLYAHMKKVHKKDDNCATAIDPLVENQQTTKEDSENMFILSLFDEERAEVGLEAEHSDEGVGEAAMEAGQGQESGPSRAVGGGVEGQSARTHCPWPLERRRDEYVLDEDEQDEQTEETENDIYKVRSDLFLHGNVMHSEDSEPMGGVSVGAGAGVGVGAAEQARAGGLPALEGDLLLDAPSVDIAQEELYSDAVDDSSFRVFLLSGEDLT